MDVRSVITLGHAKEGGDYQVKDPEKLIRIAKEWGVETEGKDIYDLAHEMADLAQEEYGKIRGFSRWLKRAPAAYTGSVARSRNRAKSNRP